MHLGYDAIRYVFLGRGRSLDVAPSSENLVASKCLNNLRLRLFPERQRLAQNLATFLA